MPNEVMDVQACDATGDAIENKSPEHKRSHVTNHKSLAYECK
jgi:hypothetical protein